MSLILSWLVVKLKVRISYKFISKKMETARDQTTKIKSTINIFVQLTEWKKDKCLH